MPTMAASMSSRAALHRRTKGWGEVCRALHHPRLHMVGQDDLEEGMAEGIGQGHQVKVTKWRWHTGDSRRHFMWFIRSGPAHCVISDVTLNVT